MRYDEKRQRVARKFSEILRELGLEERDQDSANWETDFVPFSEVGENLNDKLDSRIVRKF